MNTSRHKRLWLLAVSPVVLPLHEENKTMGKLHHIFAWAGILLLALPIAVMAQTGTITTVAGTGGATFNGDNIPATTATVNRPTGVAFDASGNLFIAEFSNHRIRKVDAVTGFITTVAGNGTACSPPAPCGGAGLAISAQLSSPTDVAFDASGNLFIADRENHRIRRVDALTGTITTVAGTGVAGSSGDGGPATSAKLFRPNDVAFEASGNLFIGEFTNHRARKVDAVVPSPLWQARVSSAFPAMAGRRPLQN